MKHRSCGGGARLALAALMAATLAGLLTSACAAAAERVEFDAVETIPGGSAILPGRVSGLLTRPDGAGPFPAVILLHGCGGLYEVHRDWADLLTDWGYVTLRVDSFGPRGIEEICTDIMRPVPRTADVNGAIETLSAMDFVDAGRIAVMGWSHGAGVVLQIAGDRGSLPERLRPQVKALVAIYPYCTTSTQRLIAPMLILIGDEDDWTPASLCRDKHEKLTATDQPIELVVYEGATHSYDCRQCNGEYYGHTLIHDAQATADSHDRVKAFLAGLIGSAAADDDPGSAEPVAGIDAAPGERLTAGTIEDVLGGATLEGVNVYGNPYTVRVHPDGTADGVAGHDDEYRDTGSWWIEGARYCRRWTSWLDGETACFEAVVDGDTIRWFDAGGELVSKETITRAE